MKKRPTAQQYEADRERAGELAFVACAEGLVFTPGDLLELLFILAKYEGKDRHWLAEAIAEETYAYSPEGQKAIEQLIDTAKKKGGTA